VGDGGGTGDYGPGTSAPAKPKTKGFTFDAEPYRLRHESTIPLMDFLYGKHLLRGTTSGTSAVGGTGKSIKSIVEGLAMSSGKDLLRVPVMMGGIRVLLINLEDDRDMLDRRIHAAAKRHRIRQGDIGDRLFTVAKGELTGFRIAEQRRGPGSISVVAPVVDALVKFILDNKIDVVSIDPFIKTHGVNENDNSAVADVVDQYDQVATLTQCAIHLWHHNRKGNGGEATIDSTRGASSFVDAVRSAEVMETMSKDEAESLGIENRRLYFRTFNGKVNFAPPSEESTWFKIASVELDNGGVGFGDDVGVVLPWTHPGKVERVLTPEQVERIKQLVQTGQWREDVRAAMWVGKAIAQILGLDHEDRAGKVEVKKIVKDLIKRGVLKIDIRKDKDGDDRPFIVVGDGLPPSSQTGGGNQGQQ
jgi:hypothetical protein